MIETLEFIQITRSSGGRAKSPRPRRQVIKDRKRSLSYVENIFGRQRRHRALQPAAVEWVVWIHSTFVENPLQIHPFLCKINPFFRYFSPKTMILLKNKPNINPTQTQANQILARKSGVAKPKKPDYQPSITFSYGTALKYFINKTWANTGKCHRKYYNKLNSSDLIYDFGVEIY